MGNLLSSGKYKEYFYSITGFFVIEDNVLQTTNDLISHSDVKKNQIKSNQKLIINYLSLFLFLLLDCRVYGKEQLLKLNLFYKLKYLIVILTITCRIKDYSS